MSNDPAVSGEGADDLLGRWLAHHDQPTDEGAAPPPRRTPTAARLSEAAAPRVTRPSASAALADLRDASTVDRRDGLGPVAPPSAFGVRRGIPGSAHSGPSGATKRGADGEPAELDRPSPVGFEPIIIKSVRKKAEPKEEPEKGKEKDKEKDNKRGRFARLRARIASAPEPEAPDAAVPVALYDEPSVVVPPPVFKTPPPAEPRVVQPEVTQPQAEENEKPRETVAYEDMIALATAAALPTAEAEAEPAPAPVVAEVEPEPEPEPGPEPEPEPEPVLPGPDTEPTPVVPEPAPEPVPAPTPEPVLPGPDTAPSPLGVLPEQQDDSEEPDLPAAAEADTTRRRLVARRRRPETDAPEKRKRRAAVARGRRLPGTGTGEAARGLLAAARAATPTATTTKVPAASPGPAPAPAIEPVPMLPAATMVDTEAPRAPRKEMPAVYEFAPRRASRRFLSLMWIAGLAASGYLGYGAYQSRDTIEMGIAGIVIFATLVIWGIRAGASITRLTVRQGQLEIVRQGGRMVFDLASTYTPIEVIGKPGSKKWKVFFLRRGMAPVIVDSTMVDGRDFMRILSFYRPEYA